MNKHARKLMMQRIVRELEEVLPSIRTIEAIVFLKAEIQTLSEDLDFNRKLRGQLK